MENLEPMLITGAFRSGTTLISQILRNHREIELVYDSINFMRFSYGRYDPLSDFKNVAALVKEIHKRVSERWNMKFDYESVISNLKGKEVSYGLVYNELMTDLLLKDSNAKIWGEKTTLVWTKIPQFFEMFPKGRVIHITRDPRAILASWKKMTQAPGNDYLDAILNCRGSMELMEEYKVKYKNKRYVAIKFEDLVNNPEKIVKEVCNVLDIKFDEAMLDPSKFVNKFGDKWEGNSMFDKNIKSISNKTVDLWKSKLEDWEIWLTEFLISDLMDTYDYKKLNIDLNDLQINDVIEKIESSALVSDGILKYLFTGRGFERFPSDPLNPNTWEKKLKRV